MRRIAIYARKSVESDKGDSINIQVDKCRNYITSTSKDGDELEFFVYQDEGYTGANTYRPDFQRLMRDIEQGKIDVLVCYRLDRISRSVADFTRNYETLKKRNVSFVSINEKFDTTTPMGEFMLLIAAGFAELERATIAERIKDNMYAMAKTDRWTGGKPPLGYKGKRVKHGDKFQTHLEIDEEYTDRIKIIFQKYLEFRSLAKVDTYLLQNNIKGREGKDMRPSQIAVILKNPVYVKADERIRDFYERQGAQFYGEVDGKCGLMTYGKTSPTETAKGTKSSKKNDMDKWIISVGRHHGIIDADLWLEVQRILSDNSDKFPQMQKSNTALVSGILRCAKCNSPMGVKYNGYKLKDGSRGYHYACEMRIRSKNTRCTNGNARADVVDTKIKNAIKDLNIDKELFLKTLREQLKQGKQEISHNPVELIRQDIKKKEDEVKRLIARIALTDMDDLAVEYENEIRNRKQDIATLNAKLSAIGDKKTAVYQTETTIAFIGRLFDKFGHIDELDLEEQRELVKALFKCITWNAENNKLHIITISDNDNDDDNGGSSGGGSGGYGGGYSALESIVMGDNELSQNYTSSR